MPRTKKAEQPVVLDLTKPKAQKPSVKPRVLEKKCANCGKTKPVDMFYANKGYIVGLGRDRWCKECAKEKCVNELSFREYLMQNNRLFSSELWNEARDKAIETLNGKAEYINADSDEKAAMVERTIGLEGLLLMNTERYYRFVNYEAKDFQYDVSGEYVKEKARERDSEDPYYTDPVYSPHWNGSYTQYEIEQMDAYYDSIIKVRGIEDSIGENYCRQFVKQSAIVDALAEKYRKDPSKENDQQYKNAISSLEALSQAAQLAPRYRKADQTIGLGSLGEFIKASENNNLMSVEPVFPDDQIDKMNKDFRHLGAAIQGAGGMWTNDTREPGTV